MLQDATQTPAWTVSGAAEFTQNLFTGSNTKCVHISRYIYNIYTLYLQYLQVHHLADRHQHEWQELRGGAGHRLRRHHQLRGKWSRTTSVNIIFYRQIFFRNWRRCRRRCSCWTVSTWRDCPPTSTSAARTAGPTWWRATSSSRTTPAPSSAARATCSYKIFWQI